MMIGCFTREKNIYISLYGDDHSVFLLTISNMWFLYNSLPKDLYYDKEAEDQDKKEEEIIKKKANRPSKIIL